MPGGIDIEVEEIESVAESVRTAGDTMQEAADYATEADPDMYMWGAVGLPFAYVYFEATPHIHGILQRMPGAIAGVAQRIEASAKSVTDCDDEVQRGFAEFENEPERS